MDRNEGRIVCKKGDPMWAYIRELVERRRRQVLIHSIIYYEFNKNVVTDALWSSWAMELERLQRKYPEIASECWYAEHFKDFDGSTGFNLPLRDPWAMNKAQYIIKLYETMGGGGVRERSLFATHAVGICSLRI